MNHDSISEIRALLDSEGIALKKRFGQNFLVRADIRKRIVGMIVDGLANATIDPPTDREIWEIGPGLGALTDLLVPLEYRVRVFEIDRKLVRLLSRRYDRVIAIEEGDAIDRIGALLAVDTIVPPATIVGNLPYRSASAMIAALVETPTRSRNVPFFVFLIQEELAARLGARPGTKDYSALSVLVQNSFRVERALAVPGAAFFPQPRVASRIVRLVRREDAPDDRVRAIVSLLARRAFSQRRKTVRNTLGAVARQMDAVGIDRAVRPEVIAPERFRALAERVSTDVELPGGIDRLL